MLSFKHIGQFPTWFCWKLNLQHLHTTASTLIGACEKKKKIKNQVVILDIQYKQEDICKHICFNLNKTSFTSLHFQVVLLAQWSLLPFEQQVLLYWIGKSFPGEGFGSLSPCSIFGHTITTYTLILTHTTLKQCKLDTWGIPLGGILSSHIINQKGITFHRIKTTKFGIWYKHIL